MTDLETYVDGLFRHQRMTPEVRDLREEILSNMIAKREDLMAQGFDEAAATEKAKESLSSVDSLIDGNQLTCVGSYRAACLQTTLLSCVLFWILSLPLLFFRFWFFQHIGILADPDLRPALSVADQKPVRRGRLSLDQRRPSAQNHRLDPLGAVLSRLHRGDCGGDLCEQPLVRPAGRLHRPVSICRSCDAVLSAAAHHPDSDHGGQFPKNSVQKQKGLRR